MIIIGLINYIVIIQPPIACVNEVLTYLFLLSNLKLDETLTMKTIDSSTVQFKLSNNFLRDDTLLIAVSVNITNGLDTASIPLFDNISEYCCIYYKHSPPYSPNSNIDSGYIRKL